MCRLERGVQRGAELLNWRQNRCASLWWKKKLREEDLRSLAVGLMVNLPCSMFAIDFQALCPACDVRRSCCRNATLHTSTQNASAQVDFASPVLWGVHCVAIAWVLGFQSDAGDLRRRDETVRDPVTEANARGVSRADHSTPEDPLYGHHCFLLSSIQWLCTKTVQGQGALYFSRCSVLDRLRSRRVVGHAIRVFVLFPVGSCTLVSVYWPHLHMLIARKI